MNIHKYPRRRHIEGSRLQVGDMADDKPIKELSGLPLIVEEQRDGGR
ncbi:hypothetical protein [Celeribacter sp.]